MEEAISKKLIEAPNSKFGENNKNYSNAHGGVSHENYVYMNPGSVSIPKEDSHHGYMTMEGNKFTWKDLAGTVMNEYEVC